MSQQHTELSQERKEPTVSPTTVISAGLASVLAAFVTSRFGVAQTLIGEALAAMIAASSRTVFKAHLDCMGSVAVGARNLRSVVRAREALRWFCSVPPEGRRPILFGGLLAGVVAFLLGMGTVTAAEVSASKSLSCWIWGNCPQGASDTTLPSVMGGGPSEDSWWDMEDGRSDDSRWNKQNGRSDDSRWDVEDGSSDSSWRTGGDPGNDEAPVARREPGDDRAPTTTEDTEEDIAPTKDTNPGETKRTQSCDVKEATTGSTKKDAKATTASTGDGMNKGSEHCANNINPVSKTPGEPCHKEATGLVAEKGTGSSATPIQDNTRSNAVQPCAHGQASSKEPEPPEPKEPSTLTPQGRNDDADAQNPHRGESSVQEEVEPSPEQPRHEVGMQNDRPLPEPVELTNGGGA